MINVIHDGGEHAVWLETEVDMPQFPSLCLAVHKREKNALALARRALINAIMAIEQKERQLG